ncbi:hypothetical protein OEZ86_009871 [Tetradesmus obliquus]|uniref:Uncharacterized protein n=1 Tax=Tetradesmus obliquus TaxID=3088 RepID=A0ABY8UTR5_TETOB|nr:hypothetical protein OEZ85_001308 [Tetradesmus obliquus]WIA43386.1 hypothetical protein OEZ86_009871 [Tetradesmus obliquus]
MGQVALACDVMTDVITKGGDELQALAAATTYFASNGSAGWCYDFNATLFMTGPSTYTYQSCTQGFPNTAMLPERHTRRHTLVPPYKVHQKELESECRQIFGQDLPRLKVPAVAADVKRLLREVGGVVFTNGEFDGWAGGSFLSDEDVRPAAHSTVKTRQQQQQQSGAAASQGLPPASSISRRLAAAGSASSSSSSSTAAKARVAFVSYKGASHCTDTHNLAVHSPAQQPSSWARQRRRAMQYAQQFADRQRRSMLLQGSR